MTFEKKKKDKKNTESEDQCTSSLRKLKVAYFVCIFLVDIVLYSHRAELGKVFRRNLHQIGNRSLKKKSDSKGK